MKRILIAAILLLTCMVLASTASAELAPAKCVPCAQANISKLNLDFPGPLYNKLPGYQRTQPKHFGYSASFSALAQANTLEGRDVQPDQNTQFAWNCTYQFTGGTTCWNHTMYGWFCYAGGWYCQLFGSCRWIAIGSCQ